MGHKNENAANAGYESLGDEFAKQAFWKAICNPSTETHKLSIDEIHGDTRKTEDKLKDDQQDCSKNQVAVDAVCQNAI